MATYQAQVKQADPTANGNLHCDTVVQRQDGKAWVSVGEGHYTVVLPADAVLAIAASSQSDADKVKAVHKLVEEDVLLRGLAKADAAMRVLLALMPSFPGVPMDVALPVDAAHSVDVAL